MRITRYLPLLFFVAYLLSLSSSAQAAWCDPCKASCANYCYRYYTCTNTYCHVCISKEGKGGSGSCWTVSNCSENCAGNPHQCSGSSTKCHDICSCSPCKTTCRAWCPAGGTRSCNVNDYKCGNLCPGGGNSNCTQCKNSTRTPCELKICNNTVPCVTACEGGGQCYSCSNYTGAKKCQWMVCRVNRCHATAPSGGCNDSYCDDWCSNQGTPQKQCSGKGCVVNCNANGCSYDTACSNMCKNADYQCYGAHECPNDCCTTQKKGTCKWCPEGAVQPPNCFNKQCFADNSVGCTYIGGPGQLSCDNNAPCRSICKNGGTKDCSGLTQCSSGGPSTAGCGGDYCDYSGSIYCGSICTLDDSCTRNEPHDIGHCSRVCCKCCDKGCPDKYAACEYCDKSVCGSYDGCAAGYCYLNCNIILSCGVLKSWFCRNCDYDKCFDALTDCGCTQSHTCLPGDCRRAVLCKAHM